MSPYKHILVVCQGNICRSPVGEALFKQATFKQQVPDRQIKSAGLGAMVGEGADATAAEIAAEHGLDLSRHVAQQLNDELVQWADLILVMSQPQRSQLGKSYPAAMGKTMLLGHWVRASGTRANNGLDIPDPYKKSRDVFEHVHKLIAQSVTDWAQKI